MADPEKSPDGTKESCLFFVLPAASLFVSAAEIRRQPPTGEPACLQTPLHFISREIFLNLAQSDGFLEGVVTERAARSRFPNR